MYFFLPSFCPFCFSSFCLFPIFFCFVSDSGVFLPALLAVLFFLFQKIFSFSFPAFLPNFFPKLLPASPVGLEPTCPPCFTEPLPSFFTFRLHRPFFAKTFLSEIPSPRSLQSLSLAGITISPKTDLSEYLSQLRVVFSCRPFAPSLFSVAFALFSVLNFRHFFLLCCEIARLYSFLRFPFSLFFPSSLVVRKNYPVHNAFTWPLPSFLRFACIVRFSAKTFLSEIPSPRSLQSLSHANITINPKTDLSRVSVSAPRRFSCQSFVQTLFSIAFALFSVFSLQVLFDLTLFFFSRLVLFPLRPCPCSSCLFPQALCMEKFPFPYLYK